MLLRIQSYKTIDAFYKLSIYDYFFRKKYVSSLAINYSQKN
jgi:hypothetical protein